MTAKTVLTGARVLGICTVLSFGFPSVALAGTAEEIMALARAQWAAEIAGKSAEEQLASLADDYTEFNPVVPTRLDGKATAMAFVKAAMHDTVQPVVSDMANAKVQVYGDTAILTYNFVGMLKGKDGTQIPNNAKSTRVYVKTGGKWMLVHANFAPVVNPND